MCKHRHRSNGFSFGLVEVWVGCLQIREERVGGSFDDEGVADGIWILGKGVKVYMV